VLLRLPLLLSYLVSSLQQPLLPLQLLLLQLLANMFRSSVLAAREQQIRVRVKMTVGEHVKSALALMSVHSAKMPLLRDMMHLQLPALMALLRLLTAGVHPDFPPTLRPLRRHGVGGHGTDGVRS
jgi:hypothetical protein